MVELFASSSDFSFAFSKNRIENLTWLSTSRYDSPFVESLEVTGC